MKSIFKYYFDDLEFVTSREITDYKSILTNLVDDFGLDFYPAILTWCEILDDTDPFKDKFWQVYLVKHNNYVVGVCGLYELDNKEELWLGWFGIIPTYRGRKFGKISLDFMKSIAKSRDCKKILSYVDKEGKPLEFYYKNGFKLISTVKDYLKKHKNLNKDSFGSLDDYIIEYDIK